MVSNPEYKRSGALCDNAIDSSSNMDITTIIRLQQSDALIPSYRKTIFFGIVNEHNNFNDDYVDLDITNNLAISCISIEKLKSYIDTTVLNTNGSTYYNLSKFFTIRNGPEKGDYFNLFYGITGTSAFIKYIPNKYTVSTAPLLSIFIKKRMPENYINFMPHLRKDNEKLLYELLVEYNTINDIPPMFFTKHDILRPLWIEHFTRSDEILSEIRNKLNALVLV